MPTSSKSKSAKRAGRSKPVGAKRLAANLKARVTDYLDRRPHRSFRPTRRRDYRRPLRLPGLIAFTAYVNKTLWRYRRVFLLMAVFYGLLSALIVGMTSQENYTTMSTTLRDTGAEIFEGNWGELGKAALLFTSIATANLTAAPSEAQQIFGGLLALLVWLTTVWLLRNLLAGHKVKLRDGLYNAGAPLIPSFLLTLVLVVQLLPVAVAGIGYSAAVASGLLDSGVEAMLFWTAAGLLTILSLYLIASTFFALIIVTLPGTYPMWALRTAGDMVFGRRLRILIRILWLVVCIVVAWIAVMLPAILFDSWLKGVWPQIEWLPIVPLVLLILTTVTVLWMAAYIYLLYRKVIDNDAGAD